jgi:hypothetical protein
MSAAIERIKDEFRDYVTAGVPGSGEYEPNKAGLLDVQLSNIALAGFADITKDTRAHLNADLAHAADTVAFVYGDADPDNNEYYLKTDIAGFGTWVRLDILHDAFQSIIDDMIQPLVDEATAAAEAAVQFQLSSGDLGPLSAFRMTNGGGAVVRVEDGKEVGITIPAGQTGANAGAQFDYWFTDEEIAALPGRDIRWFAVYEASAGILAAKTWVNAPLQAHKADGSVINAGLRTRFEQIGTHVYVEGTYTVAADVIGLAASIIVGGAAAAVGVAHYLKPLAQAYRIDTAIAGDGDNVETTNDTALDLRLARLAAERVLREILGNRVAIKDSGGQDLFSIDENGRTMFEPSDRLIDVIAERLPPIASASTKSYTAIPAPVNVVTFYGQSLSLGLAATPNLSAGSPYSNAKMPNVGVHDGAWTDGGAGLTGYDSLATSIVGLDGSVTPHGIEAPVLGAVNQLASGMRYADVIASDAGRGAYGIGGLVKGYNDGGGSGPYALLTDQFATYAGLVGGKPVRSVLCWMQGEADANFADTSKAGYKAALLGIVNDYKTDTGQENVHLVTYQLSSHTMRNPGYNPIVGIALAELGEEQAGVSVALPMYFLDYADGVHLTGESSRICGAYFGKAIDHYFATGLKFEPLRPTKVTRAGKVITVEFKVPAGNLVVDTVAVGDPGNLGFEVFNSVGGALLPIESVYVYGNRAVITLVGVPANPVEVGYAIGSTLNTQPAGPFAGARGCLRDEDDTRAYFDNTLRLRNFCVMFRKAEGYGV